MEVSSVKLQQTGNLGEPRPVRLAPDGRRLGAATASQTGVVADAVRAGEV